MAVPRDILCEVLSYVVEQPTKCDDDDDDTVTTDCALVPPRTRMRVKLWAIRRRSVEAGLELRANKTRTFVRTVAALRSVCRGWREGAAYSARSLVLHARWAVQAQRVVFPACANLLLVDLGDPRVEKIHVTDDDDDDMEEEDGGPAPSVLATMEALFLRTLPALRSLELYGVTPALLPSWFASLRLRDLVFQGPTTAERRDDDDDDHSTTFFPGSLQRLDVVSFSVSNRTSSPVSQSVVESVLLEIYSFYGRVSFASERKTFVVVVPLLLPRSFLFSMMIHPSSSDIILDDDDDDDDVLFQNSFGAQVSAGPSFRLSALSKCGRLRELNLGESCRHLRKKRFHCFPQLPLLEEFAARDVDLSIFVPALRKMRRLRKIALTFTVSAFDAAVDDWDQRAPALAALLEKKSDVIEELDLAGWNLSFVPMCLRKCRVLAKLALGSWFRLDALPDWLLTDTLRHLDFTYTGVEALPKGWFLANPNAAAATKTTTILLGDLVAVDDVARLGQKKPYLTFSTADAIRLLDRPYWSARDAPVSWAVHLTQCYFLRRRSAIAGPDMDYLPPYSPIVDCGGRASHWRSLV